MNDIKTATDLNEMASVRAYILNQVNGNWNNHIPLLILGLELTHGPVIEFGSGDGSTKILRTYCRERCRPFHSYDSDAVWCKYTGAHLCKDWNSDDLYLKCGLAFIDHAPGEHRKIAVSLFKGLADIIVVHDTELGGAGDYQIEATLAKFKYRLNYNQSGGGAGATAVSNSIDLNKYRGLYLGKFQFDLK